MRLGRSTLVRCFLRTYLMGANFNSRGLQNIGLAYAMDPGLRDLYSDPEQLRQARSRFLSLYNSHPWWNPMLVGYFLFLESHIARGALSAQSIERIKTTATYTLSALGDSFFSGSLMVLWSLVAVALFFQGWLGAAVAWFILPLCLLQVFKATTFWLGWSKGLKVLQWLKELNIMGWAERIKLLNALLIVLLWAILYPPGQQPLLALSGGTLLAGSAYLVARRRIPREAALLALVGLLCLAWGFI